MGNFESIPENSFVVRAAGNSLKFEKNFEAIFYIIINRSGNFNSKMYDCYTKIVIYYCSSKH